jgi:hypothetical protein
MTFIGYLYIILPRERDSARKNFVPVRTLNNLITDNIHKFKVPIFICKNPAEQSV